MCLVLKLDNGKVVSISNEQTEESHNHPVPYYNIDLGLKYIFVIETNVPNRVIDETNYTWNNYGKREKYYC